MKYARSRGLADPPGLPDQFKFTAPWDPAMFDSQFPAPAPNKGDAFHGADGRLWSGQGVTDPSVPFCWRGIPLPDESDIAAFPGSPSASPAYQARLQAYYAQCGRPRLYYDSQTGLQVTDPTHAIEYPDLKAVPVPGGAKTTDPRYSTTSAPGVPQPTSPGILSWFASPLFGTSRFGLPNWGLALGVGLLAAFALKHS